jgi:hypothetical protein
MTTPFDDNGDPVATVQPVYPDAPEADPPGRDYSTIFAMLISGAGDAETYRRRVLGWGYLLKAEGAPRSLEELGCALGISKQAAHAWLTQYRRVLRRIARELGFDG